MRLYKIGDFSQYNSTSNIGESSGGRQGAVEQEGESATTGSRGGSTVRIRQRKK